MFLFCTAAGLMTGTGNQASVSGQAHDPRHARHRSLAHGRKSCRAGKWRLYRPESRLSTGRPPSGARRTALLPEPARARFSPDTPVTKEQAAALLVRFARMRGISIPADTAPVYVAECSAWAQADVQAAYAASILDRFPACLAARGSCNARGTCANAAPALQSASKSIMLFEILKS